MMKTKLKDEEIEKPEENQGTPEENLAKQEFQSEKIHQHQQPEQQQQQQQQQLPNSNKRKAMEESLSPDRTRPRYNGIATVV